MKTSKTYRIDDQLISDMETVADKENRSVTNLIETVMKDYCANRLPPERQAEKKKKAASNKLKSKK